MSDQNPNQPSNPVNPAVPPVAVLTPNMTAAPAPEPTVAAPTSAPASVAPTAPVSTPAPVSAPVTSAPAAPTAAPTPEGDISVAPPDKAKAPGKYTVRVIRPKCIGAASCVAIAPKVFGLDDKQLAFVISEDEMDDIKLLAAQSCPTAAIEVVDTTTGEVVWPK